MKKLLYGLCALAGIAALGSCGDSFDKESTIKVYTRDRDSGTRDGFFTAIGYTDAIKDDTKLAPGASEQTGNSQVVSAVENDKYGIGYISLASLGDSKLVGLSFEGVEATKENVLNESYSLTRNFNYITRSEFATEKEQQIVEAFVAFMGTKQGLMIMEEKDGIVSGINSAPTWDSIKANYPVCTQDNKSVTIKFGGSTSVQKMAEALSLEFSKLCGNFVREHAHSGSSDAYKGTQGSEKDSTGKLHVAFLSRELKAEEAAAQGTAGKMCVDAIVAVVNKKNPYKASTATELKEIFSGSKTKWSEVIE